MATKIHFGMTLELGFKRGRGIRWCLFLEHHKSVRAKREEEENIKQNNKNQRQELKQCNAIYKTKVVICMICNKMMRQQNKR